MLAICAEHGVASGPILIPFRFWLMSAGEQRGFENQLTRVADYWFLMGKSDYYFFTILTAMFAGLDMPHVQVARRGLPDTIPVFGGPQKVELESIDFTGRFSVRAKDPRSAVMMLDLGMMQWVMDCNDVSFEIGGDVMLAYVRREQALGSPRVIQPVELEPSSSSWMDLASASRPCFEPSTGRRNQQQGWKGKRLVPGLLIS